MTHAHTSVKSQGEVRFCFFIRLRILTNLNNLSEDRWPHLQNIIEGYNDMHNYIVIHENGIPRIWNYKECQYILNLLELITSVPLYVSKAVLI